MIRYHVNPARTQEPIDASPFHQYTLDDGSVWTEFYRLDGGYRLRFPGLADFDVSADGKVATAIPARDTDEVTVEHLYINQVVPLALSRQGVPSFHASAVTVEGGTIAFLGGSGMGKSTLAASFALSDAAFLTDDSLIIEETVDGCFIQPSHASLRLWQDSVDALVQKEVSAAGAICYSDKARLLAGDALHYAGAPERLLAAYVLAWNEPAELEIEPLSGTERHMAWIENSFLLDIKDKELLARHFDWTHRVSGSVPTFSLDYPREYGILPEVRAAVTLHCKSIVR